MKFLFSASVPNTLLNIFQSMYFLDNKLTWYFKLWKHFGRHTQDSFSWTLYNSIMWPWWVEDRGSGNKSYTFLFSFSAWPLKNLKDLCRFVKHHLPLIQLDPWACKYADHFDFIYFILSYFSYFILSYDFTYFILPGWDTGFI